MQSHNSPQSQLEWSRWHWLKQMVAFCKSDARIISISVWSGKLQFVSQLVFSEKKQKPAQWAKDRGKYLAFIYRLYNMNALDEWSVGADAVALQSTTGGLPVAPDNQPCRASIAVCTNIAGCTFHPTPDDFNPLDWTWTVIKNHWRPEMSARGDTFWWSS